MIVSLFLINLLCSAQSEEFVYSLKINYFGGEISEENLRLVEGNPPDRLVQPEEGYTLKVISFKGDVLNSFKFEIQLTQSYEPPEEWFDEEGNQIYFPDEIEEHIEEEVSLTLIIPYYKTAQSIEIYNAGNELVLSSDVSKYSTCNQDNICGSNEDTKNCPYDCKQFDLNLTKITPNFYWIMGIIVIVAIVILTILHKFRKRRRKKHHKD